MGRRCGSSKPIPTPLCYDATKPYIGRTIQKKWENTSRKGRVLRRRNYLHSSPSKRSESVPLQVEKRKHAPRLHQREAGGWGGGRRCI